MEPTGRLMRSQDMSIFRGHSMTAQGFRPVPAADMLCRYSWSPLDITFQCWSWHMHAQDQILCCRLHMHAQDQTLCCCLHGSSLNLRLWPNCHSIYKFAQVAPMTDGDAQHKIMMIMWRGSNLHAACVKATSCLLHHVFASCPAAALPLLSQIKVIHMRVLHLGKISSLAHVCSCGLWAETFRHNL